MESNNYAEYIYAGLGIAPKFFIKFAFTPLLLTICAGIVPGVVMGGFWLAVSIIMLVSATALGVVVCICSLRKLTIQNRLLIQTFIYVNWILQYLLVEIMLFTISYGFKIQLFLLFLPVIFIPIGVGMRNAQRLKKNTPYYARRFFDKIGYSGGWTAVVGAGLAGFINEKHAVIVILISVTFLVSLFSLGLLSIQRLYYLRKLKNFGVCLE